MAHLFIVENNVALPNTETLLISPFKEIWDRDKTKNKQIAINEFTFIELMTSKLKTNPYAGHSDDTRFEKLRNSLFTEDWEPDALIEQAMCKVDEFQREASLTYSYYSSVVEAAEKMKGFFRSFDINAVDARGQRVWKPKDITSAMVDTEKVLQNLNSMKEKVEQELFEATKTKANKSINYFEK